jgi:hypothetical protein
VPFHGRSLRLGLARGGLGLPHRRVGLCDRLIGGRRLLPFDRRVKGHRAPGVPGRARQAPCPSVFVRDDGRRRARPERAADQPQVTLADQRLRTGHERAKADLLKVALRGGEPDKSVCGQGNKRHVEQRDVAPGRDIGEYLGHGGMRSLAREDERDQRWGSDVPVSHACDPSSTGRPRESCAADDPVLPAS